MVATATAEHAGHLYPRLKVLAALLAAAPRVVAHAAPHPRPTPAAPTPVLAVGDEVDIGVATGDKVLFSKYSSSDVEVPDGEVCFVAQKSVLAKLS